MAAAAANGPRVSVRRSKHAPKTTHAFTHAIERTLAKAAPHVCGDVTLVLTDDRTVRRLNRRYRGIDRATDVLSFELGDGRRPDEPFGDIVVSVDAARRQAREYGARPTDEIVRLVVHGALHLCGHDHHERAAAARMNGLARRVLKELQRGG